MTPRGLSAVVVTLAIGSGLVALQLSRGHAPAGGQGPAGVTASRPVPAQNAAPPAAEDSRARRWQPAAGLTQLRLWPEGHRIERPETDAPEAMGVAANKVAGRPWTFVENVSTPTMTIYPPQGKNTGAAIMVFPGGGYQILAIDLEGTEVCDWVTAQGVTCILLKYRVPQSWRTRDWKRQQAPAVQLALQDAQRAMGLIRQRAAALAIDPHKIGVIGFSAGGHLVAAISNAGLRSYAPVDAADRESARPDFAIALYPGHLWSGRGSGLSSWNAISRNAPPTFLVHSIDDPVDNVHNSTAYAAMLREAKVPVELHLFAKGGHAFGLRPGPLPILKWPALASQWLHTINIL